MFKLLVCVSVLLTVVGADYDFKDSDFNELLFESLRLDLDDDLEDSMRFKRDVMPATQKDCHREKGKKDRDFHCCSGEKADSKQFDLLKEVKKKCTAEIRGENAEEPTFDPFDCERMQAMKEQMVCTSECIANKFGLLEENGALKRDALIAHLSAKIGDNKWKADALEGYVDKCLDELKVSNEKKKDDEPIDENNEAAKDEKKNDVKKGCNQCPLQFTHCIWREFVQGCPADKQVDSGKCKKIRDRLAKGDTSYLHKSFFHHLHSRHEDRRNSE